MVDKICISFLCKYAAHKFAESFEDIHHVVSLDMDRL